ncbi:hypothetical protein DAI22_06g109300 [Oryza sativa Japonica Group]|nr:hypothetical protein DAI22_06g109300 [Oryza sativa Japonica Group]
MTLLSFVLFLTGARISPSASPALCSRPTTAGGGQMWSSAAAADGRPHPRRLRSRPSMAVAATCASPLQLHGPTGHHRTCLTFPGA